VCPQTHALVLQRQALKKWFAFYSSQMVIVYQAGRQLQKVDNANTPIPELLLCVPWKKPLRKN